MVHQNLQPQGETPSLCNVESRVDPSCQIRLHSTPMMMMLGAGCLAVNTPKGTKYLAERLKAALSNRHCILKDILREDLDADCGPGHHDHLA